MTSAAVTRGLLQGSDVSSRESEGNNGEPDGTRLGAFFVFLFSLKALDV